MANTQLNKTTEQLFTSIVALVQKTRNNVAVFVNAEMTFLYWSIGKQISTQLKQDNTSTYGKQILVTLSQQLTKELGKGFSYSALTRMVKIAECFKQKNIATLSQQLSWSHFIELANVKENTKRQFYTQLAIENKWSIRVLRKQIDDMLFERSAIAKQPEKLIAKTLSELSTKKETNPDLVFKNTYVLDFLNLPNTFSEKQLENALISNIEQFIMELGNGFAFMERQKRISIDAIDYFLDLLFYHRKLKRLVAIDLKIGKFKPEYKAQMELYLRWLQKNEMQKDEHKPLGLLLCSEGNTEHIELLLLDEKEIKVAQYLTELPSKKWFAEKLHKAIQIAKTQNNEIH